MFCCFFPLWINLSSMGIFSFIFNIKNYIKLLEFDRWLVVSYKCFFPSRFIINSRCGPLKKSKSAFRFSYLKKLTGCMLVVLCRDGHQGTSVVVALRPLTPFKRFHTLGASRRRIAAQFLSKRPLSTVDLCRDNEVTYTDEQVLYVINFFFGYVP